MYREKRVSDITVQNGFTYNAVAPPGPKTLRYIEGAVYLLSWVVRAGGRLERKITFVPKGFVTYQSF